MPGPPPRPSSRPRPRACTYVQGAAGQLGADGHGSEVAFAAPRPRSRSGSRQRVRRRWAGGHARGVVEAAPRRRDADQLHGRVRSSGRLQRPRIASAQVRVRVNGAALCSCWIGTISPKTPAQPDTEILPSADGRNSCCNGKPASGAAGMLGLTEAAAVGRRAVLPVTLRQLGAGDARDRADDRRLRRRGLHVVDGRRRTPRASRPRSRRRRSSAPVNVCVPRELRERDRRTARRRLGPVDRALERTDLVWLPLSATRPSARGRISVSGCATGLKERSSIVNELQEYSPSLHTIAPR